MAKDYIYVNKSHRPSNPQFLDYMNLSSYLRMMHSTHGMEHDPIAPFDVPSNYNCFKIVDKAKAMLFCLKNGDVISKPELNS